MKTNPNKKSILVIDNDLGSRILITAILKERYNIIYANSKKEAFEALKQSVDIILLEIFIDKCSYALAKEIKKLKPKVPLIALTACNMNNENKLSLKQGCDVYISKPYNAKLLLGFLTQYNN